MPEPPEVREPARAKVALASMLLATAAVAVLVTALRTAFVTAAADDLGAAAACGTLVGAFVAAIAISRDRRPVFERFVGLAAGAFFGAVAGTLLVAPAAFSAAAIGAAILVLFALLVRWATPRAEEE